MKPLSSKKAQTAIFIIVGALILLGGVLFFYTTRSAQERFEPEIKIVQEQVPLEFDPIRSYANDCAYSTAVEGLRIIGKQGGYISFTDRNLNTQPFVITQTPTESDAVLFTKDSDLKIPYWWYLKSANDCKGDCSFASKKPELRQSDNSIEKQLERYIDVKFKECMNNFEPFAEQGYKVTEKGKVKTDAVIASNDVGIIVQYPLSVEKQGAKAEISQFVVRVPVDLENVYELATKISNMQIKHHFLEKHVLNLLVAFSGISRDKLPPMSDMRFNFGSSMSWGKTDIKNKLTSLLAAYIPLFQVDGTYNYERNTFDSELKQRLYDSTIIPVANKSFENLAVNFAYLDFWPAYFDLNCKGEVCKPSSASSILPIIGLQTYRFGYDLSFPVMVEVQDPLAFNGQGYTFNFFLEGNIRNNKFIEGDFAPLEVASDSERSQLCDARTSGNITVKAIDSATKQPIEDAQVMYTLTGESCFISSTDADGMIKEQFPVGVGGYVNAVKEGYIGKVVEFDAQANTDSSLKVELQPIYAKNIVIKKKNVVKALNLWGFVDEPVDLSEKETAAVTLTRLGAEDELEYSTVANYEGQQKENSVVEIAPGDYQVDMNLLLNERIIIPAKEKCFRKFLFSKECFTIPKVDFGEGASEGYATFPSGGLKLKISISPDDLKASSTITLYAVNIELASVPEQQRVVEDLEQMGKTEEYSNTYQVALQPKFE